MFEDYYSYHIKKTDYYFSTDSKFLFNIDKLGKIDFSANGANLTICLLNLNRVKLTIKLLTSLEYYLPEFKGDVLIIDNASTKDQLDLLKDFISTSSLNINIKELKANHGVGRARNIAARESTKDWIMFLDNDMYFIKNPLPSIKNAIDHLGCSFLNIPLINYDNKTIFALGGALFTDLLPTGYFIGGGSCYNFARRAEFADVNIPNPFLSDFLFGGASVINRAVFIEMGGFDYDMFVGFEDIDFSLRLYNKGIKVGNINDFSLVHNHKPSTNIDDLEAEKKRFSNEIIKKSAEAFTKKTGLIVFDHNTEQWLKERQKDLNITFENLKKEKEKKKKVALLIDGRNWAFHNIAKNVMKHLGHKYELKEYFHSDYTNENWLKIYVELYEEKPDIIFFFWRPMLPHLFSNELNGYLAYHTKISTADYESFINNTVILTAVYDHLFLKPEQIEGNNKIFNDEIDGYFVASNKLMHIYNTIESYPKPYNVIQDGVDLNRFFREKDAKFSSSDEPLVLGWAGNSEWGIAEDGIDHKGFNTIIKPAIEELKKEGFKIDLIYANKHEPQTFLKGEQMNSFYNKLDAYICTSDIEGTPNPVLESMAVGIGIITTEVGIVKEVFGKEQQKFILEERSVECLKNKIKTLYNNREILQKLAKENAIRISHWTWESKCEKFDELFEYYLFKKENNLTKPKKFPYRANPIIAETTPEHKDNHEIYALLNDAERKIGALTMESESKDKKIVHLEEKCSEIDSWYQKEYEVLPMWYKKFGHIVKVINGRRTMRSLF